MDSDSLKVIPSLLSLPLILRKLWVVMISLQLFYNTAQLFKTCSLLIIIHAVSSSILPSKRMEMSFYHPIPKSKDTSSVTQYRPISLLCCISKVLEKLVFDKINVFILDIITSVWLLTLPLNTTTASALRRLTIINK